MKLDQSKKTKLSDYSPIYINAANGWIYFTNESDGNSLYKIKIDGTDETNLNDNASENVIVIGNGFAI